MGQTDSTAVTKEVIVVYVRASSNTKAELLDEEDQEVEGVYQVTLGPGVPEAGIANAALDGFHNNVGVSTLDDFEFTVHRSPFGDPEPIAQSGTFESYSLSEHCIDVTHHGELGCPDQVQVSDCGNTVWVHGLEGSTVGRFSKVFGMDVHRTATQQMNGEPQCLHCTHEPGTKADWVKFCELMQKHFAIAVDTHLLSFEDQRQT